MLVFGAHFDEVGDAAGTYVGYFVNEYGEMWLRACWSATGGSKGLPPRSHTLSSWCSRRTAWTRSRASPRRSSRLRAGADARHADGFTGSGRHRVFRYSISAVRSASVRTSVNSWPVLD